MTKTALSRDHTGELLVRREDAIVRRANGSRTHHALITESNHALLYCDRSNTWIEPGGWVARDGDDITCASCTVSDGLRIEMGHG
jgi:hypothetical protein